MKKKIIFIIVAAMLAVGLIVLSYYIKIKYPTIDILSSLAVIISLCVPMWGVIFPKKQQKKYHVSPQKLSGSYYWLNYAEVVVAIQNTGDVPVNIKFAWLETDSGIRFTFKELKNSLKEPIKSTVRIEPHDQEDLSVIFKTDDNRWDNTTNNLADATNKNDLRLADGVKDLQARIVWYDTSDRSQEVKIPFGWWLYERVKQDIEKR